MRTKRPRVAVIGGGIFGASAALELSLRFDVTLLERGAELLSGATYANHNRHHYGFHYPRSPETVRQCLESRMDFERLYGGCLDWDFDNYYCIAKKGSKTAAEDYTAFCRSSGLDFSEASPPSGAVDASKIALSLKVREAVYDIPRLRGMVARRVTRSSGLRLRLGHDVIGGRLGPRGLKILTVSSGGVAEETYDFVVNATYAGANRFCRWFGFPKRRCQFNLQELDVVELPLPRRIGVTILDGPFPSIIPLAHTRCYLMAHVVQSQLLREVSCEERPLLHRVSYVESNWSGVLKTCADYIPLLRRSVYRRSLFVDRVVDSSRLGDDSRLTEITSHGNGCWSLFSAKVITCVTTASKLSRLIVEAAGL